MRDDEITEPFYKELYDLCNNGSIWLIHTATKKMSSIKTLNRSKLGRKIKLYIETISDAIITQEGSKYALPLMMTIAYFILPFDAVPDMMIPVGMLDDLGILTTGYIISKKLLRSSAGKCGS